MDDKKIVYDSNEISNIISKIGNNTSIIEVDIISSLDNDFSILRELDFFNEGLDKISSNARNIISLNDKIVYSLNSHDSNMNDLNNKHLSLFSNFDTVSEEDNPYDGVVINIDEIKLKKITDGKIVLKEYINSVVFKFDYDRKLVLLKRIINNNSLGILTDKEQADALIYQLKNVLKEDYSMNELSKLSKEEEFEIQKDFFKAISSDDKNIFDEIKENSLLHGLSYFKEVCKNNNISIEDLIYDDKNKELFIDSLSNLYKESEINNITSDEITSVKEYINDISKTTNISPENLLNVKYSSVLKGGIFYED